VTRYLTVEDAVRQAARHGFVMRDVGLFAAAIQRPAQSVFGEDAYKTLCEKAAAMCHSLDHSQSLLDGDKRMAWVLTKLFLLINGRLIVADQATGADFMLDVVAAGRPLDEIAEWLEENSREVAPPDLGDDGDESGATD
jgi:death-on-curing protein